MRPVAIDFFAGAGGLSEGLSQAGFDVALANEYNKDAAATYRVNHPDTILLESDIKSLQAKEIMDKINGTPLLVAGGPPCQGFSMAGKRRIGDPRNHMFFEFINKIKEIKPRFVLAENVVGLLTFAKGEVIKQIKSDLDKIGYHVSMRVLNAVDFGVPQSRKRIFIFGSQEKGIDINDFKFKSVRKVSSKEAIGDLEFLGIGESSFEYKMKPDTRYQRVMRRGAKRLFNHESSNHSQAILDRYSKIQQGMRARDIPEAIKTKKKSLMRLDPNLPINTITTIPDDYIHYSLNRTLTVRECARMQSFRDTYVFLGNRTTGGPSRRFECPQYSQVGNAIAPPVAKAIGEWIIQESRK